MADDIGSKLGFDASDAINSINKLKKELDSYNEALIKTAGGIQNFNASQTKVSNTLKQLSASAGVAAGNLKSLASTAQSVQNAGNTIAAGAAQGAAGAQKLTLSWQTVIRVFGTQFAARAVASLVSAFTEGIRGAREFEIRLAEIQTISKEFASTGIESVGAVVQKLSAQFGRPVEDVAKGLYQTLSNQVGNATESIRFLTDAFQFSVATVTTTEQAVNLLSGVVNAYGLSASSATRISDELFKTIELGRVTGGELADTFNRVTTLGAQLGVSTATIGASIAELTIKGGKASDALTQLSNVFQKLVQPSEATKAKFRELGVSSAEMGIQIFGLFGFLRKLTEGKTALSEIADLLGGRIRAIRGVGTLTGNAEELDKTLKAVEESAGATKRAFDLIDSTNAQQLTKQLETIHGILVNDIGRSVVAFTTSLIAGVGGAKAALVELSVVIGTIVGGAFLIFLGQAALALKSLGLVAAGTAGGIGLLTTGLAIAIPIAAALATLHILKFNRSTEQAKKLMEDLQTATNVEIKIKIADALPGIKQQQAAIQENVRVALNLVKEVNLALQARAISIVTNNKAIFGNLADHIKDKSKLAEAAIKTLEKQIESIKKRTQSLTEQIATIIEQAASDKFERSLKNLTAPAQAESRTRREEELNRRAAALAATGKEEDQKRAVELLKEALDLAKETATTDGTEAEGERQVKRVLEDILSLRRQIASVNDTEIKKRETLLANTKEVVAQQEAVAKIGTNVAVEATKAGTAIEKTTNDTISFGDQFHTEFDKVGISFSDLEKQLKAIQSRTQKGFGIPITANIGEAVAAAKAQVDAVTSIKNAVLTAIQAGDIETVNKIQAQLLQQSANLNKQVAEGKVGAKDIQNAIKTVITNISAAITAWAELKKVTSDKTNAETQVKALEEAAGQGSKIQTQLQQLDSAIQRAGQGATDTGNDLRNLQPVADTGVSGAQAAVNSFSTASAIAQVDALIQRLVELASVQAGVDGGIQLAARGGLIYRANGGFVSRGTDTIPAMLSEGEFVVNARSSKRFFSELVAMNSGRKPIFRQDGGPVTNVTGDININIPAEGRPVDGRQLALELRRQLRRRTIR